MHTIPPKHHHPDLRWVIVSTAIVTALIAGIVLGGWPISSQSAGASDVVQLKSKELEISSLQEQVQSLQVINDQLQVHLKLAAATPAACKPIVSSTVGLSLNTSSSPIGSK